MDKRPVITKDERRDAAIKNLPEAAGLAASYGLRLKHCSIIHYQLTSPRGWLLNIYPGNYRLYADKNRKPPYVQMLPPWTLLDIVKAFGDKEMETQVEVGHV